MRTARAGIALGVLALAVGSAWLLWRARRADQAQAVTRGPVVAVRPAERIRVEVLNSTRVRGLARNATVLLRNRGFDVVLVGTAAAQRESTLVLDRSSHPDWARRVAAALGGARVEVRPDSAHYVDVSVLLGNTWRPPAQALHP
jgi:hypothetical protein